MAKFMAMGSAGGAGATITVTYSSEFYGQTLTATNGTETHTATATSSGSTEFKIKEGGAWTISCTVGGSTYTTTTNVEIAYNTVLEALPDGSTVLPTDDIQTWLKCAGITDKTTYTTLADVLADTDTFIALCADSNACDYMARSTNWASGVAADSTAMLIVGKYNYCANKLLSNSTWASAIAESAYVDLVCDIKVPVMTSNTTPSGTVSASSYLSGYDPWKAFNPSNSSGWIPNTESAGEYIIYEFPTAVKLSAVVGSGLQNSSSNDRTATYHLYASTDGSTYTDLNVDLTLSLDKTTKYSESITTQTAYKYIKAQVVSGEPMANQGCKLQFYGRTDNANYIPLVPKMTSNTTPRGEVIISTNNANAYKAFDGVYGSVAEVGLPTTVGNYIGYEFSQSTPASRVKFVSNYTNGNIYAIQGFDGTNWTDITTFTANGPDAGADYTYSTQYIELPSNTNYIGYRIYLKTKVTSAGNSGIWEIQFYRKSDLPIIHSAVEDSIFYMDDGSPVALCGIPVGDTIDVDLEAYKGQTLTLVSTVAKDPDNLSNDFSMNVRITPNITEIYLMPYGALYWWGHMYNCEDTTTANGWALTGTAVTFSAPTHNKNDITATSPSDYNWSGIGTKKLLGSSVTKLKSVTVGISTGRYSGGQYLTMRSNSGKTAPYSEAYGQVNIESASLTTSMANITSANSFNAFLCAPWGSSGTIKAFWLE